MKAHHSSSELVNGLDRLVRKAAKAILDIYGKNDFAVDYKSDASPLTEADMESHRILMKGLKNLHPQLPVLSEENASHIATEARQAWDRYWLVDPLDGTREFI
ncbi:MAG: 3'(2'),5'-bisphosphate nucleotidase CysQ, partial [Gammaproteobacteria bacterium]|nr:3'(2'),5'-bisphosphate nucleotidase CysQ [Gammaproteobacteria bacterium]